MKFVGKIISFGIIASATALAAAKLVDMAYNKIGGRYITFTGKDYNHIPEDYPEDQEL